MRPSFSFLLLLPVAAAITAAPSADIAFLLKPEAAQLLDSYCMSCHDEETRKGDIRLDALADLPLDDRLDLLNTMQEQLYFAEMPPSKKKKQPTETERRQLVDWVSGELQKYAASKLEDKLRKPEYGNYVDHDKLFSGAYKNTPGFTPARRWLINEYIFEAKFNVLLNHTPFQTIDGKREFVIGDNNRRVNLTNPFLLPTNTGVRDYDTTVLDGGHLLTMLTNAKEAATYMAEFLAMRDKRYLPAMDAIMSQEWAHEKTLASRETFLTSYIDRLLADLYLDRNEALLPTFVRTVAQSTAPTTGLNIKKAAFHAAQPGQPELALIFVTMRNLEKEGDTDEQLIEKCEKEWFNAGHNERTISSRVTFLNGYMAELRQVFKDQRYDEKMKNALLYRPLPDEEMKIIGDSILKNRQKGDHYSTIIAKCMKEWSEGFANQRKAAGPPNEKLVGDLVDQLFVKILERQPTPQEAAEYGGLTRSYIDTQGNLKAIEKVIQTLLLNTEFVYRLEFGDGQPDEYGRKMLSPREASYAISYALTDSSPDAALVKSAQEGKLNCRADYAREVTRLLKKRDQYYVIDEAVQRLQLTSSITNLPIRKLRFFREFFGYPYMLPIFKDNKRFGGDYDGAKGRLVGEADQLVEHILQKDQHVFEELLTTEEFYVYHSGDNEAMTASSQRIRKIYDHFKDMDWQNFSEDDLKNHVQFFDEVKMRGINTQAIGAEKGRQDSLRAFKTAMTSFTARFDKGQTAAAPFDSFPAHGKSNADTRTGMQLRSPEVAKAFNIKLDDWNYPSVQPAKVEHRKGMLTHPAWLIAHANNTETDPVRRGKWVREKLLAGTVPDVPITVDAVIPEDSHNTLRTRLVGATEKDACWKCHERMNPLGYTFEAYDDFGRFRTEESLEYPENLVSKGPDKAAPQVDLRDTYKTLPVNAKGHLAGTGDATLDGEVVDAMDLATRLAKSARVRQSIIRHAFRFFMGRNEILSDSKTLIDADQAYLNSNGSFDAVILSLLTSDSFIYRKQ